MVEKFLQRIVLAYSLLSPLWASAQETKIQGFRVDFAYDFKPGGGLKEILDIKKATGPEKTTLYDALSLGVGGEIKVAYTKGKKDLEHVVCFYNVPGNDFFIHEPKTSNNRPETIEVLVGLDKNPKKSRWISLGVKSVKNSNRTNHIPYDMDENLSGIQIHKAYWILVRDNKSKLTPEGIYSGFEMSAAIIKAPCIDSIS